MSDAFEAWSSVIGADDVRAWFGAVPRFHDSYIKSLQLEFGEGATLGVRAFRMTDKVDDAGFFVLDRHALVTFRMVGVQEVQLQQFDTGSVLADLTIERSAAGYDVVFVSHVGLEGRISAAEVTVHVEACEPEA